MTRPIRSIGNHREDPPTPEDGTCAQCGQDKRAHRSRPGATRPVHEVSLRTANSFRHIAEEQAAADPFCSVDCCHAYYGVNYRGPMNSWVDSLAPAPGRKVKGCKSCHCPLDQKTPGCKNCYNRHRQRSNKPVELTPSPA